jgi:hypothetical protein
MTVRGLACCGVSAVLAACGAAAGQCSPSSTNFCVTTGAETLGNLNPGPSTLGVVFYLNGVESPAITLTRGQTYTFSMVNGSPIHPFYLCLDAEGAGSPEWTDGVSPTGGVSGNQVLTFAVPAAAPDTLYYGCEFHFNMGWRISIVNGTPACYANCDGSTTAPVLNVLDFNCFLNSFAAGASYANCDGSTTAPVLNVLDFNCFLNRFAAGCP